MTPRTSPHRWLLLAGLLLALTGLTPFATAQTGPGLALIPMGEDQTAELKYDLLLIDGGDTDNNRELNVQWHQHTGRWQLDSDVRLGHRLTWINLDTLDGSVPERMVDAAAGFSFNLGDTDQTTLTLGGGYAGTTPFADGDALYAEAAITHRIETGPDHDLLLMLSHNGNRAIFPDVPLPAVSWRHRVSDELTYSVGLPISSIRWTPNSEFTLNVRYLAPFRVDAEAAWHITEPVDLFARFENRFEAANLDHGPEHRRVFLRQRQLEAGVRWAVGDHLQLEAAGGYAFDRELERGWDVRDTTHIADFSDEPYARVNLAFTF